jgi:hypothetical protein
MHGGREQDNGGRPSRVYRPEGEEVHPSGRNLGDRREPTVRLLQSDIDPTPVFSNLGWLKPEICSILQGPETQTFSIGAEIKGQSECAPHRTQVHNRPNFHSPSFARAV